MYASTHMHNKIRACSKLHTQGCFVKHLKEKEGLLLKEEYHNGTLATKQDLAPKVDGTLPNVG